MYNYSGVDRDGITSFAASEDLERVVKVIDIALEYANDDYEANVLPGDSTVLNDAVATQDTITQLADCSIRQADRDRPREFDIHESDGTPDEKESRPKQQPPGYQACMMRSEMWPRRQETIPRN